MAHHNTMTVAVQNVQNGQLDGCIGETLLAPCKRKKRLQRKMTEDNYWIGVQKNISMFSKL